MTGTPAGDQTTSHSDPRVRVGLDPQPMVDWMSPKELVREGVKVVLAAAFGNYADKREVQAALSPGQGAITRDYSDVEDLWFDYVADIGDGFNPTYAVAWLLAKDTLSVAPLGDGSGGKPSYDLPAGRFLVLGGDQVYPSPRREEYRKRFVDPWKKAFDTQRRGAGRRETDLFVLPGNHDWYDGLTAFVRLFCQRRTLGLLRTCQQRSYFALRLSHDWWLWGLDIQLESDIDEPQKLFFKDVATEMRNLAGERVPQLILCTGQPTWVRCGGAANVRKDTLRAHPDAFATLSYFEELIAQCGAHLAVTISGDLHHFSHYAPNAADQPHRITSGGGGAYLYPTHHLPARLDLPVNATNPLWMTAGAARRADYHLAGVYPPASDSRSQSWRVLALPWNNRSLTWFIGGFYVLFAWILQSASKSPASALAFLQKGGADGTKASDPSLMDALAAMTSGGVQLPLEAFWHVLRHSPSSVLFAGAVVFGLWKYRASEGAPGGYWGAIHGALHVVLCVLLLWLFSVLNLRMLGLDVDHWGQVALFTVEMLVVGGGAGALLMAIYLLLSARLTGVHINDVYSSQAIQDWKNFLRLHIRRDGVLEIYPIGVPTVPRDDGWKVDGDDGLVPATDSIPVHLAGAKPIEIPPAGMPAGVAG